MDCLTQTCIIDNEKDKTQKINQRRKIWRVGDDNLKSSADSSRYLLIQKIQKASTFPTVDTDSCPRSLGSSSSISSSSSFDNDRSLSMSSCCEISSSTYELHQYNSLANNDIEDTEIIIPSPYSVISSGSSLTNESVEDGDLEQEHMKHLEFQACCTDCGKKTYTRNLFTGKRRGFCSNEDCKALLCKSCKNSHVLIPFDESEGVKDWSKEKLRRFCRKCFMEKSNLDFSRHTELYEPDDPETYSGVTLVFTHGAGGSRAVFRKFNVEFLSFLILCRYILSRQHGSHTNLEHYLCNKGPHALLLSQEYGHRCIMVDLPGHGSRWEEKCTLENCLKSITEALEEHEVQPLAQKRKNTGIDTLDSSVKEGHGMHKGNILIGSSWGGYIAYYACGKLPQYFNGVITDGSTVDMNNPLEILKWNALSKVANTIPIYHQLSVIRKRWAKKGRIRYMNYHDTKFGVGVFSKANPYQSMKSHNFWDWIPLIECPALFISGTLDGDGYCEKTLRRIMEKLKYKKESKVLTLKKADHLLTNDAYHYFQYINAVNKFSIRVCDRPNRY